MIGDLKGRAAVVLSGALMLAPLLPPPALAYTLQSESGGSSCPKDGKTCTVFCNNGSRAGSMNWNGSVWTDGVKWDADQDTEARKICAANGAGCV